MFGFSFGEFLLICVVALVAVGPKKLPALLGTLGKWIRKARTMLHDMRAQSGIDDILRAEGLHGGLNELRGLVRHANFPAEIMASVTSAASGSPTPPVAPEAFSAQSSAPSFGSNGASRTEDLFGGVDIDASKEYPPEGADAYGALPDDLAFEIAPYALPTTASVAVTDAPLAAAPIPALVAESIPIAESSAVGESPAEPEVSSDAKPAA